MEELLSKITLHISKYRALGDELTFNDTHVLNVLLKDLSSDLFYLEKHRDNYARKYNSVLNSHIKNNMAVSKADIIAKEDVPELYLLRRIMTSAYKVLDAMRSNQSFLKNEK